VLVLQFLSCSSPRGGSERQNYILHRKETQRLRGNFFRAEIVRAQV
jgi:hypothetical protein